MKLDAATISIATTTDRLLGSTTTVANQFAPVMIRMCTKIVVTTLFPIVVDPTALAMDGTFVIVGKAVTVSPTLWRIRHLESANNVVTWKGGLGLVTLWLPV